LHNSSYNEAHLATIAKAVGLHPEHVTAYSRICDALPVRLATHTAAIGGMWAAQARIHTPCLSFDRAHADPWLGCWVIKALALGGSRTLRLPVVRAMIIFTPTNLPGCILLRNSGGSLTLPSLAIAPRGDLHANDWGHRRRLGWACLARLSPLVQSLRSSLAEGPRVLARVQMRERNVDA
jgi:hypothetical protein